MHRLIIAGALAASVIAGPAAFAATAPVNKAPAASPDKARRADCEKQWKAEKKHDKTHKAFVAACMKG